MLFVVVFKISLRYMLGRLAVLYSRDRFLVLCFVVYRGKGFGSFGERFLIFVLFSVNKVIGKRVFF